MAIAATVWIVLSGVVAAIELFRKFFEWNDASLDKKAFLDEIKYQSDNVDNAMEQFESGWETITTDDRFKDVQNGRKKLEDDLQEVKNMSTISYLLSAKACKSNLNDKLTCLHQYVNAFMVAEIEKIRSSLPSYKDESSSPHLPAMMNNAMMNNPMPMGLADDQHELGGDTENLMEEVTPVVGDILTIAGDVLDMLKNIRKRKNVSEEVGVKVERVLSVP